MKHGVLLFRLVCVAFTLPLWLVQHPPLVDLPQHAAQVAIARDLAGTGLHYADVFRINWLTPYLFGYLITWLFALVLPIAAALKVVLSLSLIGTGWIGDAMNRALGGRASWSFCLLPGLYCSAFLWGFFNFVVCIPLALGFIWAAVRHAQTPSRRSAITLAVFGSVLCGAHVLAAVFCCAIGAIVTVLEARAERRSSWPAWPFLVPLPIGAVWMWMTRAREVQTSVPVAWGNPIGRPVELLADLTMLSDRPVAIALSVIALAAPWLLGARPRRAAARWAPLAIAVCTYLFFPDQLFGTYYVNTRFAVFVLPLLLLALEPAPAPTRIPIGAIAAGGGAATALLLHSLAWVGFASEAQAADAVLERIAPGRKVLNMAVEPGSDFMRLPVFEHYAQWYVVERGGYVDFSFASFFPELVRFRPEALPAVPDGMAAGFGLGSTDPTHRVAYDYRLIRGGDSVERAIVAAGLSPLVAARSGPWWLVEAPRPPAAR
jgi:hypothetical protein